MCNYVINENLNGIEIGFESKPNAATISALKAAGFRWHNVKRIWYAKQTAERLALAVSLSGDSTAAPIATATTGTPQNHIKIFYNGLKVDGGKLIKCGFDRRDGYVRMWGRDYDRLPRDLFNVENNSDSYTDYFKNDSASVPADHPLYKYVEYAAIKSRIHDTKQGIKYYSGRGTAYKAEVERLQAELVKLEKELKADPGQPTQEDLDQINRQRQEAENARREAEHEEDLRRREKFLNDRCNGMHLIEEMQETFPLEEGKPIVTICWSESPKFAAFEDGSLKMSLAAADVVLRTFDKEYVAENGYPGGYDKTKFLIEYTDENGEPGSYEGRYDIGDNENGILDHIRNRGEWYRTHEEFGKEKETPDETNDILELVKFFEAQIDTEAPTITIKTPFGDHTVTRERALMFAINKYNGITNAANDEERLKMVNSYIIGAQFTAEELTAH